MAGGRGGRCGRKAWRLKTVGSGRHGLDHQAALLVGGVALAEGEAGEIVDVDDEPQVKVKLHWRALALGLDAQGLEGYAEGCVLGECQTHAVDVALQLGVHQVIAPRWMRQQIQAVVRDDLVQPSWQYQLEVLDAAASWISFDRVERQQRFVVGQAWKVRVAALV